MPNTDTRAVKENYWYTSDQISAVANNWAVTAERGAERFFIAYTPPEEIPADILQHGTESEEVQTFMAAHFFESENHHNQTGLTQENLPIWRRVPQKIFLPFNKGRAHWTAITIHIVSPEDIRLCYSDSLNTSKDLKTHSQATRQELNRIANILQATYPKSGTKKNIKKLVYPHAWQQADGASCGHYTLANAFRCLALQGAKEKPGKRMIREQQLNKMPKNSVAVRGASSNIKVDAVLTHWVRAQFLRERNQGLTSNEAVETAITEYAQQKNEPRDSIIAQFNDGYTSTNVVHGTTYRLGELNRRLAELFFENNLPLQKEKSEKKNEKTRITNKIDKFRKQLAYTLGNETEALQLASSITLLIHRKKLEEAKAALPDRLDAAKKATCSAHIDQMNAHFNKYNQERLHDEKIIYLAQAYGGLAQAKTVIKLNNIYLSTPEKVLAAHITLLEAAIYRDSASLIRQVCFAIQDFCSRLLEFVSFGYWEPNIKRIHTIRDQLSDTNGSMAPEALTVEKDAIQTLLDAKKNTNKEAGKRVVFSDPPEPLSIAPPVNART